MNEPDDIQASSQRRLPLLNLSQIHPRSLKYLSHSIQQLVKGRLWLQVVVAMALGLGAGMLLGPGPGWVPATFAIPLGNWLALPGHLFLATIQMIVIPLVFASIIRGLAAGEDLEQLRRVGVRLVLVVTATTALAAAIGIGLAQVIRPGERIDTGMLQAPIPQGLPPTATGVAAPAVGLGDLPTRMISLLPDNPLNSMVESQMLQVVVFAIIFGVALASLSPVTSKPLLELMGSLQEVCLTVVRWAMRLAPLAVFGLLAQLTMKTGLQSLLSMGIYVATVLLGLLLLFGLYMVLLYGVARVTPGRFLVSCREVLLLAFSTSSSAAVMPLSIKTAEEQLEVRPSISQFVIPLCATINMTGTALYQGVAAIFLAQAFGVEVSLSGLVLLVFTAVGASVGSPATPGVGIVILAMLLGTIGVPASGLALILGVDRILDMSRTAINVAGDLVLCKLMDRWVGSSSSHAEELAREATHEEQRLATGTDVIIERAA